MIVGIGLSDYPVAPHLDALQHHAQAMQRALDDCGMHKSEIDGYMCTDDPMNPLSGFGLGMAEYLQIDHRYADTSMTGGSVFEYFMHHATAAIAAGYCDTILVTYGSNQLSGRGRSLARTAVPGQRVLGTAQFEAPYGNTLVGNYALAAQRHMHQFGTTPAQLAEIAVAVRGHAQLNPLARYRDPITVDDVLNSRMVADPLHMLDCCAVTDGGGAIIVTTAERAKDLRKPPVYVLGAATAQTHWLMSQMPDFTVSAAAKCGPEAFAMAGVTPDDIDTVQIYDSFTITVLTILEDLGFCKKGEGGPFVEEGVLRLGGRLPLNTDGGGLSSCHPGMRGIFLLIEATRQIRGEAGAAQVPNCKVAAAVGSGGLLSCIGTGVLGKEPK